MGGSSAGGNQGGGGSPNQMAKNKAKAKAEKDRIENAKTKTKFGYTKPKNKVVEFMKSGGVIGAVTKPFRDKMLEVNTKFYNEKVVPAGKSTAPNYETYMKDRLAGKTDAYGNPTPKQGGGNDNKPTVKVASIPKVTTAPTEAEVSQSAATDATAVAETKKEDDVYTRKRKSKARGRSMMTLTSAQGLKKDDNLVLGKRSLLGS